MPSGRTCWRSLSGDTVPSLLHELRERVGDDEVVLHVGTDSKHRGNASDFITVVAVLSPGRGGRAYYRRDRTPRARSLAEKLIHEAQLSIDVALELSAAMPQDIVLHIDANEDERHRSSRYARMLAGMALGNGFEVRLKPNAWCASSVADHVVNGHAA